MQVVRPRDLSEDTRSEIGKYLLDQWERAEKGRASQVDNEYANWDQIYRGVPAEMRRSTPWAGASNLVVPLVRMHLDTFVARTLGIVFGTQRIIKVTGFPQDKADALEKYLEYKAIHQWDFYRAGRDMLQAGSKNGTATLKIPWVDLKTIDVMPGNPEDGGMYTESEVSLYKGPRPELVPFEDFYVYPITATRDHQVQIKFHRLRYTAEDVRELCDSGRWLHNFEDLKLYLMRPTDAKTEVEQADAGVTDYEYEELSPIECHFRYPIAGKYYDLMVLLLPEKAEDPILDLYFNPYPKNINVFESYRPFPREKLWYGESLPAMLSAAQEECSTIHNDRRNNSYIANSPMFKKKSGAMVPNPSTGWFPGKVWDVESMDDFEPLAVGRNYDSMLDQEGFTMNMAERITGIGAVMQGQSQGSGKRGIYNTGGTIAMMSEGNERQNTNIRDYRNSLSAVAKTAFILQKEFGPDDPALDFFPPADQQAIREALEYATSERTHLCPFEVRSSTAAMNKEVDRQNLMQMAQVLQGYYQQVGQISAQLMDKNLNPGVRMVMNDVLVGMKSIAKRILRSFDEMDPEGALPDVAAAIEKVIPGGSKGATADAGLPAIQPGAGAGPENPLSRAGLEGLLALPGGDAAPGGGLPPQ